MLIVGVMAYGIWYFHTRDAREPSRLAFLEHCAACHGVDLRGTKAAPSLVGRRLIHGEAMANSAGNKWSSANAEIHDWRENLPENLIKGIALYVSGGGKLCSTAASISSSRKASASKFKTQYLAVERVVSLKAAHTHLPPCRMAGFS